jgi:hypothetical protein
MSACKYGKPNVVFRIELWRLIWLYNSVPSADEEDLHLVMNCVLAQNGIVGFWQTPVSSELAA